MTDKIDSMTVSAELSWRGFVNQTTFKHIEDIDEPRTFYLGVDPSSDSMQVGNLAAVMLARHLITAGHTAIVLVGGATGMIGDPKDTDERDLKSLDEIRINKAGIAAQYTRVLQGLPFEIVDNYEWFKEIKYLDFLRDIGKLFSMTQLLDRDFVKSRIGENTSGISYAEFSYSLIQGYDYLHLYRTKGVTLQIGGSDQWGNMLSGVPLISRLEGVDAHVWTIPLVINKTTGKKFGKSEDGAIWLDEGKTSVFAFYQFWLNSGDADVIDYLKIYTMLSRKEIEHLALGVSANPAEREAQKKLAYKVTELVHGKTRAQQAQNVSSALFGSTKFSDLSDSELEMLALEIPVTSSKRVIEALVTSRLAASNSEAKRLIEGGAVSVNGEKITDDVSLETPSLIKKGKNTFLLAR